MKYLSILVGLVFIISCAQTPKHEKIRKGKGTPAWIYSAQEGCEDDELCASGEGQDFKESDLHAKNSLSAIFETKITSNFLFSKEDFSGEEQSKMREYVNDEINQEVEYILKGVTIKDRYQMDNLSFSLATLHKPTAIKLITEELEKIDDEMSHLFYLKKKIYIKKLYILFNKREILNEKLILLDGAGVKARVTPVQIDGLRYTKKGSSKIFIEADKDFPRVLRLKITEYMTSLGYSLSPDRTGDYLIRLKSKAKEEYINVRGFKKFTFTISIEARDSFQKQVGENVVSIVSTGRNQQDAFLKVRAKILKEIENNIEKLNLE